MNVHSRAKTTPVSRALLVIRIESEGWSRRQAAEAFGLSVRRVAAWLKRYREEQLPGLNDRSSRPQRSPSRTPERVRQRILELRQGRLTGQQIAARTGVPRTTVSRILRQNGVGRLRALLPPEPIRRYEHPNPGDLLHIDIKKLGRIVGGIGHRITGDRRRKKRRAGWEHVYVCVDDHSRLSYVESLRAEDKENAAAFLERALLWFQAHGVYPKRLLTDNGKVFRSLPWRAVCLRFSIRQSFTQPYRPRTNGKAERFIQTMLREWAYQRPYSCSAQRRRALPRWLHHYNLHRSHSALGNRPPASRVNNLLSRNK